MWLKCFVLVLVLVTLVSAQEKSCVGIKTQLTILSGDFTRYKRMKPRMQVKVRHPYQATCWTKTKMLGGTTTPQWNHVLNFEKGSPFYDLFLQMTMFRRFKSIFVCRVKANAGQGTCIARRGCFSIKYALSC